VTVSPMARNTRERVLTAARTLLVNANGELSVRAVARKAGVSPSVVYLHFANKSALIELVTHTAVERFAQSLWRTIAPLPVGSIERLVRLGHEYIRFAEDYPADYALLFARRASTKRSLAELPQKGGFEILTQCVQEAMDAGALKPADPVTVSMLLWTRVHGIVQLLGAIDFREELRSMPGHASPHAVFAETSKLLFAGLAST
jgi:AcrR family transcriptional regulator